MALFGMLACMEQAWRDIALESSLCNSSWAAGEQEFCNTWCKLGSKMYLALAWRIYNLRMALAQVVRSNQSIPACPMPVQAVAAYLGIIETSASLLPCAAMLPPTMLIVAMLMSEVIRGWKHRCAHMHAGMCCMFT